MRNQNSDTKWLLSGLAAWMTWRAVREWRYPLEDKSILITGGSRGLGLVLARQVLARGARVALCARNAEELEKAKRQLEASGQRVWTYPCDLTDRMQVEETIAHAMEQLGGIDVLINNAGAIQVGPEVVMGFEDYEQEMNIHFWGPLYAIKAVLPRMRARREGRIVNIASIGGKISIPHLLPYSASKFALVGLSEGLTAELAREGVRVTTVCPGLMRTGSPRNITVKGQHRAEYAWFKLSDSLPLFSMSAERAARKIISAFRRGDSEVVLSTAAKVGRLAHGVFPGGTARVLGWVNRLLPRTNGDYTRAKGHESQSPFSESVLTRLTDSAALRNNEV